MNGPAMQFSVWNRVRRDKAEEGCFGGRQCWLRTIYYRPCGDIVWSRRDVCVPQGGMYRTLLISVYVRNRCCLLASLRWFIWAPMEMKWSQGLTCLFSSSLCDCKQDAVDIHFYWVFYAFRCCVNCLVLQISRLIEMQTPLYLERVQAVHPSFRRPGLASNNRPAVPQPAPVVWQPRAVPLLYFEFRVRRQ